MEVFHQPSKSINLEQDLLLLNGMANGGRSESPRILRRLVRVAASKWRRKVTLDVQGSADAMDAADGSMVLAGMQFH